MNKLLTTENVAPIFGVTPKTISLWALQGILKGVRIGKRWYFAPDAVEQVMETNGG